MTRWPTIVFLAALTSSALGAETTPSSRPASEAVKPGELLKEADGTEFRFSYFPSQDRLRLLVLRTPQTFSKWETVVSPQGKSNVLARGEGTLPFPKTGVTIATPPLSDGVYQIMLALISPDGTRREFLRTFERKHFAWENNRLGQDRVVIPPFTPLVVQEKPPAVACVLRQHKLDGVGLWEQVTSQGRELLASPMRLEFEAAGRTHVAQGSSVIFTEKADDRVAGNASWSAGPVRGRTQFEFDYDGMAKFVLHLEPCDVRVDAMQLVIPMKTGEAWLMHPVTDQLRFHYAGRIPNGKATVWDYGGKRREVRYTETGLPSADGKVWDSSQTGRFLLPGPFVPYIWFGGPERGIAWFAENDRDWSSDPNQPCMEIRRQGLATSLVVRMMTKPTILSRPRTLVFGLTATPAKPMPDTPVSYRRWWPEPPSPKTKDTVGLGFMGACYYWGAAGPCFAFYPAFQNFTIYDEFARLRQGGEADKSFTGRWLQQFSAPEFQELLKTYRAHVDWSLRFFAAGRWRSKGQDGQAAYVMPYTNARAIQWGPEVRTFMDEWSTMDIADPRWPGDERFVRTKDGGYCLAAYRKVVQPNETSGIAYAIDPLPSWQDLVLYYHRRMLETFADGIYFDDYFLTANCNPAGPGYVDDDGNVHAGVNMFGFHDLTKRVAVMQYRMGRRPMVYIHMTNANIVPMLSFGTLLLDHEWRDRGEYLDKDFQDRLCLDDDSSLLLAQSTGLQSGCLGILHNLFHGDPRLNRSALGVALTHEMRMWVNPESLGRTVGDALCNFGYGLSDCRVWRYWDDAQPLTATGAPAKTLTLARGGRAMAVIASFGPDGDVILELDLKALALPKEAAAVNVETGQPLERIAPGRFKLALPRHDFRLVRFE